MVSAELPPIVDRAWVTERLDRGGDRWQGWPVVVCQVGSTMATPDPRAAFDAHHLPGAVFVSLEDDLSGPPAPVVGRHPLPSPEHFAAALAARGVGDDAVVLACDDRGGAFAARLVWMLRTIGQPAALLDGPAVASLAERLGAGAEHPPATRVVRPWPPEATADADRVSAHVAAGRVVVDARDAPRYAGEVEPIDAIAGHVPGAVNVAFAGNLGPDGSFLAPDALAARFAAANADGDAIVYCGSGVTACHNALAIEQAGLGRPAVYVGSWSGWSSDPSRPVATGAEP